MNKEILVKYSLDESEFLSTFQVQIEYDQNFDVLKVYNVPTALKGLELISKNWFLSKICHHENLLGIKLKINEEFNENFNNKPHIFDFKFKESFLISFQSNFGSHESKNYWKIPETDKFYSLFIEDDKTDEITTFCQEVLIEETGEGRTGILKSSETKDEIKIHELCDGDGSNLLIIAAFKNRFSIVQKLVEKEFDVDDVDNYDLNAVDNAWMNFEERDNDEKEEANQIILCLINANSRYPAHEFEYGKCSKNVQKFIDVCESLHKDVDKDDFEALKNKLEEYPHLVYFYNKSNESLLAHALRTRKFQIFDYLDRGITTGAFEDLEEVHENMLATECRALREKRQVAARDLPDAHLVIFRSKTKISNNDRFSHTRWTYIKEAYKALNSNSFCSKILKILAECKKVKIFFDFKHDSVYYLDPMKRFSTKGTAYTTGTIYIGAKNLTDEEKKSEVFGALAHELCHLAVFITFMNRNLDPFQTGESDEKRRFIDKVMKECREKQKSEEIVENVFGYAVNLQESEMIVTAPQMLMHYYKNEGKIEELKEIFTELFKYCEEVVEPEFDKVLPLLKILEDEEKEIIFDDLSEPMKAKILHSKVKFQGVEITLIELIGNDQEILKLLDTKSIRNILMKNEVIEISEICELSLKYGIIERSFVELKNPKNINSWDDDQSEEITKSFDQIITEIKKSKVFILSDFAGTGKTTIFKNSAIKLKEINKKIWVSFINLRKHEKIYEKYKSMIENLNHTEVVQLLLDILHLKSEFESKIFSKLFSESRTILLFDGVDEISPKYTNLLKKMLIVLKDSGPKNEVWVSTRPHYAKFIEEIFKTSVFKFLKSSSKEKTNLIENILRTHNIDDQNTDFKTITTKVNKCIHMYFYERIQHSVEECNRNKKLIMDNPLMIEMITELFIEKDANFDINSTFGLYSAIIEKQKEKVGEKIPNKDRDPVTKFSIWDVHHIYALKLIITDILEQKFGIKIKELAIMKKWQREKMKWSSDMIQRYGFMSVDLNVPDDDRSSIDFAHRTYAEFFIAQFILNFIFDDNEEIRDEEIDRKFKLFDGLMANEEELFLVLEFIFDYIKNEAIDENQIFYEKVQNLLFKRFEELHKNISESEETELKIIFDNFKNYAKTVSICDETSRKLWKIDENKNILQDLIPKFKSNIAVNFKEITVTAEFCFGPNWHEKFNKSDQKLITDEELKKFVTQKVKFSQQQDANRLLKLCDLIDKNFDADEKKIFYEKVDLREVSIIDVQFEIIPRMREAVDRKKFLFKCLQELNYEETPAAVFATLYDELESNFDPESIQKLLFGEFEGDFSPLLRAVCSQNLELFCITKNLFTKYKSSWTDVQNVFLNFYMYNFLTGNSFTFYPEYTEFVKKAFKSDRSKLMERINKHFRRLINFEISEENYEDLKEFLCFIFENHPEDLSLVFGKVRTC